MSGVLSRSGEGGERLEMIETLLIKQLMGKRTGANVHLVNTAIWYLGQYEFGSPIWMEKYKDKVDAVRDASRKYVNSGDDAVLREVLPGK